ncbi:MAG: TRAP transporter small permease subunit, partial [Burkholderiales bacterium]|nr:TRAP transporter small permease subunit [Burkholderiales bacterium]
VDFFYRFMPRPLSRAMGLLVDVMRIVFFGLAVVMSWQMMQKLGSYKMTVIDLPMNIVYGLVMLGFAAMFVRSFWVLRVHWRRGYCVLERPESTMDDR